MFNYDKLPEHMRSAARRYIEQGIEPGGFLRAVIMNDLNEAVGRADLTNRVYLVEWVEFFYNETPSHCWGSPERYGQWVKSGGLQGMKVLHSEP